MGICVFVVLLVSYLSITVTYGQCPHEMIGLRMWSNATQWPNVQKPGADEDVVISDAVLFDDVTPRLRSITVSSTGHVVWSPSGEYHMTAGSISIEGRLDIGSEDCKFDTKARITLIGDRYTKSGLTKDGSEKGLMVRSGGTLEIHGKQKLSWTKLNSTLPKLSDTGALVFNHKNFLQTSHVHRKMQTQGLYVYVFNPSSAAFVNFRTFRTTAPRGTRCIALEFKYHLESVEDGNIVMIASNWRIFSKQFEKDLVYDAIEKLLFGSGNRRTALRDAVANSGDAYAMFAIKGDPSKSQEVLAPTDKSSTAQSAKVIHLDRENEFKYTVVGYFDNKRIRKSTAGFTIVGLLGAFPILNVIDDTSSWRPGDRIFLTSTDYDWKQAEEATVVQCRKCTPTQVRIDLEARYTHWGEITDGVDMRGEVALLTRYVLIEGEVQDSCPPANGNCNKFNYDTFGGQVKIFKNFENVHIEGAELYHMGQQTDLARYPIHFHMCADVDWYDYPPYIRETSIHNSFSRCITVHGTHGVTLQDNVGYKTLGHCFFLEDGGEMRTVLDGNLGASIRAGSFLPSDSAHNCGVFWISCPVTYFRNNVAAGSEGHGIWFVFPDEPHGPSKEKGWFEPGELVRTKISEFTNNVAHSCGRRGLSVGMKLTSTGRLIAMKTIYGARQDPLNKHSALIEVPIHRATLYKNRVENAWIRALWVTLYESGISDAARGVLMISGSRNRNSFHTSIVLGDSPNKGEPQRVRRGGVLDRSFPLSPQWPMLGYLQYGSPVKIYNTWFNYFGTTVHHYSGAFGFIHRIHAPIAPRSSLSNISWGFDDGIGFGNRFFDGNKTDFLFGPKSEGDMTQLYVDVDGSATGRADTTILPPRAIQMTDKCSIRENWKLAVCPYRFGKLWTFGKGFKAGNKVFMMRDDIANLKESRSRSHTDFAVILGGLYSYTLHWTTSTPHHIRISGRGVELDYPVRIGVCLPLDAKFRLRRTRPFNARWKDWTAASSVSEIDDDVTGKKYFWDSSTGLLFVKMQHDSTFKGDEIDACPHSKCDTILIDLISGTKSDSDCSERAYGPYTKIIVDPTSKITLPDVVPKTSSAPPEGYGAGVTRPFRTRQPVDGGFGDWTSWGTCSVACGGGERGKTRSCDTPIPQHGGKHCVGKRMMTERCNVKPC